MNLGFRCAQAKYICMLSDDCLLVPGAIENGVKLFNDRCTLGEKVGAVAFYWRNCPEDHFYKVGLTLGNKLFVNHGLFLKSALREVGYADESSFLFYHADGDLSLKLWQHGYTCLDSPKSFVEHFSHANTKVREENIQSQNSDWEQYLAKWQGIYYLPELKNVGGWVKTEYSDVTETAEQFKPQFLKRSYNYILRKFNKSQVNG